MGRKGQQPSHDTILLNIFERLGTVETQNKQILANEDRAADGRAKMYQGQEELRHGVREVAGKIDSVTKRVSMMEPDVTQMKGFRAQLAIAVFMITTVVTGAINLLYIGFTHLGDIKTALREFMK